MLKNFEPNKLVKAIDILSHPVEYEVAATPADIVLTQDRMRLLHYQNKSLYSAGRHPVPVLIVYALINRHILLDLEPGRSFVQNLINHGFDIYLIDWGYPLPYDRYLNLADYIDFYMDKAVEYIREYTNTKQINLMGICMGGTFIVIYAALYPEKVKNIIALAAPIQTDIKDSILFQLAKMIDPEKVLDAFGNLPGKLANFLYLLSIPVPTVDRYIRFFQKAHDPEFVKTFLRLEKWSFDSPDMAGGVFRDYIVDILNKNLLIKNELNLNSRKINLSTINCPLFNAFGVYDHLVPPASSKALSEVVSSDDITTIAYQTGHIGMFVGKNSIKTVIPDISRWMKAR